MLSDTNSNQASDSIAWRLKSGDITVSHAKDEIEGCLNLVRRKLQERYATLRDLMRGTCLLLVFSRSIVGTTYSGMKVSRRDAQQIAETVVNAKQMLLEKISSRLNATVPMRSQSQNDG